MILIIILNFFALILLIKKLKIDKSIKMILGILLLFSFLILEISNLNLYNLNEVNVSTYFLWILYLNIFVLTYVFLTSKITNTNCNKNLIIENIEKSKVIIVMQIVLMIILLFYSIRFSNFASLVDDKAELRMIKYTYLFGSQLEYMFYNYIVSTIFEITSIIVCILIAKKKLKNIVVVFGIINIFLEMSIGYGRMQLFRIIIYIIIASFLIKKEKKKFSFKRSILIIVVSTVVFMISTIPTALRLGINIFDTNEFGEKILNKQIQQVICYFTGGFRTLDAFIDNGIPNVSYTIGRATLGGIDEIVCNGISLVNSNIHSINSVIGSYTQRPVYIGKGVTFNAFYTCIMDFYLDFGIVGVFIGAIIHALLLYYVTNNYLKKKNLISAVLCIFVFMNAFSCVYIWPYQSAETMSCLIVLLILNKKGELVKNEDFMDS